MSNLKNKLAKILGILFLVRLGLYIPVPSIDLDIFTQGQDFNPLFGFARNLTGSSYLGIGALGILPYINSSIIIQLLVSAIPSLERLQKEDGELGRQKINRYTRYLTFGWALVLSLAIAIFLLRPVVFNWNNLLALKVVLSLTTGSLLSMWFAELITEEKLGNGSSMIIFMNIVGGIPASLNDFTKKLTNLQYIDLLLLVGKAIMLYLSIVFLVVLFQDAYKKINIISARQVNINYSGLKEPSIELQNSYIPIKLNQGGIMPLVFSSTIATVFYYPLQAFATFLNGLSLTFVPSIVAIISLILNMILILFFSEFYALLVLKPNDIAQNLAKMTYTIPGIKQGMQTTQYLKQTISRLAFMGGLFLVFLAFCPIIFGKFFQFFLFKNITSLLILVGVITDVTSQIRGYLVSRNYKAF